MQFIPSMEDVREEDMIVYCVIFSKPYNFPIARGFMNLYNYTGAHMIETESWIIFYQQEFFKPKDCETDDDILRDMQTIDKFKPKCMSFFDDKVTIIMFREPFWLL